MLPSCPALSQLLQIKELGPGDADTAVIVVPRSALLKTGKPNQNENNTLASMGQALVEQSLAESGVGAFGDGGETTVSKHPVEKIRGLKIGEEREPPPRPICKREK